MHSTLNSPFVRGVLASVCWGLSFCALGQTARPQLDAQSAATATVRHRLGDWMPRADLAMADSAKPDFVVSTQGKGTHRNVQDAIDALPAREQDPRKTWVIEVQAGEYREMVCAKDKAPFHLRGESASKVRIVHGRYASLPKLPDAPAHPCVPNLGASVHGTSGSTSVAMFSDDVTLSDLTIENDAAVASQAVALTTLGDRIHLYRVNLLSHQDTFYVRKRMPDQPARVYVQDSLIAGDVDFVFGGANLVIERSELRSRARRVGGYVLAPSTLPADPFGFLVTNSRLTAEPGVAEGSVALGRAWDAGVQAGTWVEGVSPNGQAVIRDSAIGKHITGWAASTSKRAFDQRNRLYEFNNTGSP